MDEQQQTVVEKPARPRPKRKYTRRIARPVFKPPAQRQSGNPFEGMTPNKCGNDCIESRCVITHENVCGHPAQGLQPRYQTMPDVLKRRKQAELYLALQKAENKHA